ncbi:MAG: serine--tRNA ligase [Helicobacteraceae bacterium]|jgi:seryl-tRNA synthetase|nr:serine--tRNA ligase [Helicobacteraceae bacterium]
MIDLKRLEQDFDAFRAQITRKKVDEALLESVKTKAIETKRLKRELEERQALQNRLSKDYGRLKASGESVAELEAKVVENKSEIIALTDMLRSAQSALENDALNLPNPPDSDVPNGEDENDNVELSRTLTPRVFDFAPKAHFELGIDEGWFDFERAAKISCSRFTVMRGLAAKLERALIAYMIDFNESRGFKEAWLPVLVSRKTLTGTAQLPKFEADLYLAETGELPENDLFLTPTAEAPLINLFYDEIIHEEELPIKMTAHTLCFRKEAGSAGRDTRGMMRQHQFDKVELAAITAPEDSNRVFDEILSCASDLLTSLELPHRRLLLCSGDMGFSAAKTIDIEAWIPSENRYREISSVSNTRDFQPRRAKIRYKSGKTNRLTHALNGSSLAVGRTLIALLENHQLKDGSVRVPPVLLPYLKQG